MRHWQSVPMPSLWIGFLSDTFWIYARLNTNRKMSDKLMDYTRVYISKHNIGVCHHQYISIKYFGHILRTKNWNQYSYFVLQNMNHIIRLYKFTVDDLKILKERELISYSFIQFYDEKAIRYMFQNISYNNVRQYRRLNMQELCIAAECGYLDEFEILNEIIYRYIKSERIQKFIWAI